MAPQQDKEETVPGLDTWKSEEF